MIEYLFFIILVALFLKPMHSFTTLIGKTILLAMILYITCVNPVLGIASALLYIQILPVEGMKMKKQKTSRLPLDESMRPKNSNQMKVSRPTSSPSNSMQKIPVETKPLPTGNYTPF